MHATEPRSKSIAAYIGFLMKSLQAHQVKRVAADAPTTMLHERGREVCKHSGFQTLVRSQLTAGGVRRICSNRENKVMYAT